MRLARDQSRTGDRKCDANKQRRARIRKLVQRIDLWKRLFFSEGVQTSDGNYWLPAQTEDGATAVSHGACTRQEPQIFPNVKDAKPCEVGPSMNAQPKLCLTYQPVRRESPNMIRPWSLIPSIPLILFSVGPLDAQTTASSDPVGYVTTSIAPSPNGVAFTTTPVSTIMLQVSSVSGVTNGQITALSSNTVTVASAGWATNQLSSSQAYLLVKGGELEGLLLRIISNTADTAVLDTMGINLSVAGLQVGNTFQLVQGDTLLSMFGTAEEGVVGGSLQDFNAGKTDRVTLRDTTGVARTYYFNTDEHQWRRPGSPADQGNVQISPYAGVFYARIGQTPLNYISTGVVPTSPVKIILPASGITFVGRVYPTEGKISDFGFDTLPDWKKSNLHGTQAADRITTTDASGVVRSYFHDGSQWRRPGSSAAQSTTPVKAGGAVSVLRNSDAPQILEIPVPYTL